MAKQFGFSGLLGAVGGQGLKVGGLMSSCEDMPLHACVRVCVCV